MRLASFAALSFLQKLDHRGGSKNPGGFVTFQGEESFVAGHEKLGLAGFSQHEQVTVLGVRPDGARMQVPAKKREVRNARREQLSQRDQGRDRDFRAFTDTTGLERALGIGTD